MAAWRIAILCSRLDTWGVIASRGGGLATFIPPAPLKEGSCAHMMKRIFMLMALALMVVAAMALSGVAQAASPKAKCKAEAQSLTGLTLDGYNFIVGNNHKNDDFTSKATAG